MSIRMKLDEILNEAAGSRPADKTGGDTTSEKIDTDVTKQGGLGKGTKRSADKGGELAAHEGTKVNDPSGAIQQGRGTEVQGNTDTTDGLGESVANVEKAFATQLAEMVDFKVDMSALKSLCESQELGEDFTASAVEIFEAAVNDVVKSKLSEICEAADDIIAEAVAVEAAALEEQVDKYLDYVVTEWAEENKLAIVQGARTEIAEGFMENLKGLLESHYVEIPDDKVDLYESAIEKGEEILGALRESEAFAESLANELVVAQKALVVESYVSSMTSVQADKIRNLAESIMFDGENDAFIAKLTTLSEGYVNASASSKKASSALVEDVGTLIQEQVDAPSAPAIDPEVARAAASLSKFVRR